MALRRRVRSLGKLVVIGGALAATFLVCAAVAVQVAVRAREVTVPDVAGTSIPEAAQRLNQEQLSLRVDAAQRPSIEVPAGRVLGQDPRPGTTSGASGRCGSGSAPARASSHMPGVVGETERSAQMRLSQEGLDATTVAEIRSEVSAAVDRGAGAPAGQPAAAVRLLVSRGGTPPAMSCPISSAPTASTPPAVLRQQGFRVELRRPAGRQRLAAGLIVRQAPAGGYQVHPGDAISLEVAR